MILDNFEFNNVVNLKSIVYNEKTVEKMPEKISVNDDFEYTYDGDGILILVTRKVCFEPDSIFDITVKADTFLSEKEESDYDKKELSSEEFLEGFEPVLNNICSRISTIISVITMASSNTPLITPPQIISEEQS